VSTWKEQETKIKAKLEAKQGHALPCHHATTTGGTFVFSKGRQATTRAGTTSEGAAISKAARRLA
jgi:hypothetical protein